jgi:hypothetical protein
VLKAMLYTISVLFGCPSLLSLLCAVLLEVELRCGSGEVESVILLALLVVPAIPAFIVSIDAFILARRVGCILAADQPQQSQTGPSTFST